MDKLRKKKKIITIGKRNHSLIVLPPEIWFSFTSLEKISLVANTINYKHDDKETLKLPLK